MYGRRSKSIKPKTQKQSEENLIKSMRNFFKLKIEKKIIKDRTIRDIKTIFEQEEDYYEPVRVGNFWKKIYNEYQINGDRNKNLSVEEYLKN